MKIADSLCVSTAHSRFELFASGDDTAVVTAGENILCRWGRVTTAGFSGALALPEKLRCHRTNDGFCAEFDSDNVIPFGCEYHIRRHWTLFNNVALLNCDIAPDNGGVINELELEPLYIPFAPEKLELLVYGDDTVRDLSGQQGKLYSGCEPVLLLRAVNAAGDAVEFACGDDLWRHRTAARSQGTVKGEFSVTVDENGITLTRKVLLYPEDAAVEKRPWKFKSILSWHCCGEKPAVLPETAEKFTIPGCFAAPAARKELRRTVRKTGKNTILLLSGDFPAVCTDAAHLERSGKTAMEHGDLGEAASAFLWANRELAKRSSAMLIGDTSALYGNSVTLNNLRRPLEQFCED